jgi:hypothetical protein
LIHRRIYFEELAIKGNNFWEGKKGKSVDIALTNYIETRKKQLVRRNL